MTLRVGLAGFGYAGRTIHGPLIRATPGLALVAVATRSADPVRAEWPGVVVAASTDALLREALDLVVVATPNATHHPIVAQALAAGCHVVVDKPFTVTHAEALDLGRRAQAARRVLSVFHNRRWDADFRTVRELIASGELGRIVHFESHLDRYRPQVRDRWRERPEGGGGLWYDLGAHLVDQAVQLFGRPAAIAAHVACQRDGARIEDWFHVVLRYREPATGLRVLLHGATLVPQVGPRFIVHGERGSYSKVGLDTQEDHLKAGPIDPAAFGLDPDRGTLTIRDPQGEAGRRIVPNLRGDWLAYYRQLRDAIAGDGGIPVTASDAAQVIEILEAGVASAIAHREVEIPVDHPA